MDLTSPVAIKELLAKHHAKPLKGLGQNFLIDKNALAKIVAAADLQPSDTIVEIGPGLGTLTRELAKAAKKVIAIEKDAGMVKILKETLADFDSIEIIHGDILKANFTLPKEYKVVANVPYYITSPIIRMFLEAPKQPSQLVLMLQKEVARRICAKPPNMSILAVSVQFYATPKIISLVSKGCFWPVPNVDSAVIKIVPNTAKPATNSESFFKIVKAGFSQPRKQLAPNLAKILKKDRVNINTWLLGNNIQPTQRAETLSIEDWELLTNTLQIE